MPSILRRRPTAVACFFCQGTVDATARSFNPSFFRCPHCDCWNRYDSRGEILSDEPAMHDERLNSASFAKRASPAQNYLPSMYHASGSADKSVFCRACQTNQTLLVNLLSNYLPPPQDPAYAARLASLPAYTASLQTRYPPVCMDCQPAVEEEIRRKETMARTQALGNALKGSKGKETANAEGRDRMSSELTESLLLWRLRGVLWALGVISALSGYARCAIAASPPEHILWALLPSCVIISLLWTSWDPTYSLRRSFPRGSSRIRVEGRERYTALQRISWSLRLLNASLIAKSILTSRWDVMRLGIDNLLRRISTKRGWWIASLLVEVVILTASFMSIRIRRPAPVRLIDTSAHRAMSPEPNTAALQTTLSASSAAVPEPDLFATLSLSNNPVMSGVPANPMFGVPSLSSTDRSSSAPPGLNLPIDDDDNEDNVPTPLRNRNRNRDPDAMDWEPANPPSHSQAGSEAAASNTRNSKKPYDDGSWLRQQRFFPPEQPTGLETMLMRTRLGDEDDEERLHASYNRATRRDGRPSQWNWTWVYLSSVVPVVILVLVLWSR